jgi:hypothetical protein
VPLWPFPISCRDRPNIKIETQKVRAGSLLEMVWLDAACHMLHSCRTHQGLSDGVLHCLNITSIVEIDWLQSCSHTNFGLGENVVLGMRNMINDRFFV